MKHIFKLIVFIVAIAAWGFQSCNSMKMIDKAKLTGIWVLKTLNGENAKDAFDTPVPYIEFNFSNNMLSGSGGCNRISGAFTLTNKNEFSAPNMISTMMACMQKNKESEFARTLSTPNLIMSIDENGLLTFSKDGKAVLIFEKGEVPVASIPLNAEALAGSWELTSIAGGDMGTLFTGKKPTMIFSEDNRISGNAGCNTYRTSYALDGNTLTFSPVASTKMACPSLKGEDMFTKLLATPLQAKLNGDKLSLLKDGNVVLEFSKEL